MVSHLPVPSVRCLAILVGMSIWIVGIIGIPCVSAQESTVSSSRKIPTWEGKATDWHGFRKWEFSFAGRSAFVVQPTSPAPGNPWVWRARFPDFHAESDRVLLERGFHIVKVNTDGMLGSPATMSVWDEFYGYLVEHGLARRCALEGVSRGGLFIYAFASQWPERVACIYADTPVCDIRSWPGGKGVGRGDVATWKTCLQQYGLDEGSAETFEKNPIDRMAPIVDAGIPMLTIVSLNDQIVPFSENTAVLKQRVESLGGEMELMVVQNGTPESHGHHFSHPDPIRVADFIERHATVIPTSDPSLLSGNDYFQRSEHLWRCGQKFRESGKGRVAFVGGSITRMSGWRELTMTYLQQRFPDTEFEFVDAGIPSTGSVPGSFRLHQHVLADGPVDLLFEEASVNDLTNQRSPQQMTRGMEGIVRHTLRRNPETAVVVMHFACPTHLADYRSGKIPSTIQRHQQVADHYGVATIDLAREVTNRIDAGQFDWEHDFQDLHPSPFGHQIYAATLRRCLGSGWDASSQAGESKPLPPRLDAAAYDAGELVSPDQAQLIRGFEILPEVDPREGQVGGGVREGFFNVPMLVGNRPADQFRWQFQGTAAGIWVVAGPDAGMIEYRIDQGEWQRRDLFTFWSDGLHLPWVHVLADGLSPDRQHQLEVRVVEAKNPRSKGHACRIVHLLSNAPPGDE